MIKLPHVALYRWIAALPLAIVLGLGLFLAMILLIRPPAPQMRAAPSSAVTLLTTPIHAHPMAAGQKSGIRGMPTAKAQQGVSEHSHSLATVPRLQSVSLRTFKTSNGTAPTLNVRPPSPDKAITKETSNFLGLNGRGHGHRHWVSGAGGLFYLPDSGLRVQQVRYVCNNIERGGVAAYVTARVNTLGKVTVVKVMGAMLEAQRASMRKAIQEWRFRPLVIDGRLIPFRLRFTSVILDNMRNVVADHCEWDKFNSAHRGSLMPTWVVYRPKHGLPVAYAYIAPQMLGESPGGLAPAGNGKENSP